MTISMDGHSWLYYLLDRETRRYPFSVIAGHGLARRVDLLPVDRVEELREFAEKNENEKSFKKRWTAAKKNRTIWYKIGQTPWPAGI